jgi:glyoxylase-like metal-dependent hydrolase (beta-lactamase superfamily II)
MSDPQIHRIQLPTPFVVGPVNVFVLRADPLTIIDTGTRSEESYTALVEGLRTLDLAVKDIERILLTHHHADHTGLAARIVAESGAQVWGHPSMMEQADLGHRHDDAQHQFFHDIMTEFGVPAETREASMKLWDSFKSYTEKFVPSGAFSHGGTTSPFRTWFVPGHSATDTLLVNEAEGYSVVGDHILQTFNPNPLMRRPLPGRPREHSLVQYRKSLAFSRQLDLGRCHPGHGKPFEDAVAVIDGITQQHERRNRRLLEQMTPEGMTPFRASQILYPRLQMENLYLALSIATGQLELLEHEGRAVSAIEAGVVRYFSPGSAA